ncbi:GAF and ANTAR domain-containing protein [Pseudonocardia benzenivorans]|jgi:GAF domain-containing protein|uniref:GAF and ANTAR domain-containing protein n=1 Tax=Pseudonocardia benzenivorans TaxID=228005 RepID=A0ABW3VKC5_9PSEU|nr:transcriptional regulator [Pseudonocardia sp. D17]
MHSEAEVPAVRPADRDGRERQISRAFVQLADTLVDDYDMIDMLDRLVAHSVLLLAADAAAIMLVDANGGLRTVAASSEDAELMELLQLQAGEGPCVECVRTSAPVAVVDLSDTDRWPRFVAAVAARTEFRSVHALPLRLRGQAIGAMNLLHSVPGPLPEDDLALGQALADVATIGILAERTVRRTEVVAEQLQTALNSRVIIEQAKGVIAQYGGVPMDQAFERLRGYSRRHNLRLAEVARNVVNGRLDPRTVITEAGARRR